MRFFCKNIQDKCVLSGDQAYHCIKVLRSKINDTLELVNGNGELAVGRIIEIRKTEVFIEIEKVTRVLSFNPNKLSIAICPTKNPARLEWFIEKATEIGIDQIYPIVSARTEKTTVKAERLQQIIISAAKQSGQLFFPQLHPIQPMKTFLSSLENKFDQYFIAHCEDQKQHLMENYHKNKKAILLIGPEGDFTKEEVSMAVNNNYVPVSLGSSVLRVETAGIMACSIINSINFEG